MQKNVHITLVLAAGVLVSAGCGNQTCQLTGLSVVPASTSADHSAAAPNNQAQFSATGVLPKSCASVACVNCSGQSWTVSDPINVSISNNPVNNGTATCVGATSGAVTVTATAQVSSKSTKTVTGTATLTCK